VTTDNPDKPKTTKEVTDGSTRENGSNGLSTAANATGTSDAHPNRKCTQRRSHSLFLGGFGANIADFQG